MNEHLSREDFGRLAARRLKGAELLAALDHLEECGDCRSRVKSPTTSELLEIIFGDEDASDEECSSTNEPSRKTQSGITNLSNQN